MMRMKVLAAMVLATGATAAAASPAGAGNGQVDPNLELEVVALKLGKVGGNVIGFTASSGSNGLPIPKSSSFSVGDNEQSVSYFLKGGEYFKNGRITADFGELGEVRGKVKVVGDKDEGDNKCEPFIRQRITFSGTIRLEAENGIASIDETKAKGSMLHAPDPDCDFPDGPAPEPERGGRFEKKDVLSSCADGARYSAEGGTGEVRHTAYATDSIGDVRVFRYANVQGPAKTFLRNDDRSEASVEPGGPFNGTGDYADGELTGDLTVELLGLPDPVALTPAKASLRQGGRSDKCSQIG